MSQPACLDVKDLADAFDVLGSVSDFVGDLGVDAVEHPDEHRLGRLPDDAEDGDGDKKSDDRVRQRKSQPHADRTHDNSETCEAISARVITVGDERRAVDLPSDPDPEDRDGFVPEKSDYASGHHPGNKIDALGMDKTVHGFVAREDGTEQDDRHDGHPGQVFGASETIREGFARLAARQHERNP
ncbi:hypothetical protein KXV85_004017, partial [Aspergillus fumigatus]